MPIAVIARPGYDRRALASPAMAWLRRYRLSAARFRNRVEWSAPALIELRFDPDPRSATAIRRADPHWATRLAGPVPRDGITRSLLHDTPRGTAHEALPAHAERPLHSAIQEHDTLR
jgi:nicotinate-nucleotide adenylyltransferase